jgi:hypothetical protein
MKFYVFSRNTLEDFKHFYCHQSFIVTSVMKRFSKLSALFVGLISISQNMESKIKILATVLFDALATVLVCFADGCLKAESHFFHPKTERFTYKNCGLNNNLRALIRPCCIYTAYMHSLQELCTFVGISDRNKLKKPSLRDGVCKFYRRLASHFGHSGWYS